MTCPTCGHVAKTEQGCARHQARQHGVLSAGPKYQALMRNLMYVTASQTPEEALQHVRAYASFI